ncbi:hypothetical protein GBAR_LOCUS13468, partial [Geodia barretti]
TRLQSAALSDSESGQKRSGQRLKRSGRPGARLQSAAALSDSESGLKRSGQGQKHSGSAHGIRGSSS